MEVAVTAVYAQVHGTGQLRVVCVCVCEVGGGAKGEQVFLSLVATILPEIPESDLPRRVFVLCTFGTQRTVFRTPYVSVLRTDLLA